MKAPVVYILASQRNGTLYIGVTSDLIQRIWQHREGVVEGFTQQHAVKTLVWYEQHDTDNTSVLMRHNQIRKNAAVASHLLAPLAGVKSSNVPPMTEAEYIALVDFTGREWHPDKRGVITADEPPVLRKLGLDKDHWTMKVKGFGSASWRVVGSLEELIEKAKELKQRTLFGIGFARTLKNI